MKSGTSLLVAALLLVAVVASAAAGALALGIVPPLTGLGPTPTATATAPATATVGPTESPTTPPTTSPTTAPGPTDAATDQPRPTPGGVHVVQEGEYLSTIAELYGIPWELIAQANGLEDPYVIYPGDELIIPAPSGEDPCARTYVVKEGDTFFDIAYELDVPPEDLAEANGIVDINLIHVGQVLVVPGGAGCPSPSPASPSPASPSPASPSP